MKNSELFYIANEALKQAEAVRSAAWSLRAESCIHPNIEHVTWKNDGGWDCMGHHPDSGGYSKCPDCGRRWDWMKCGLPGKKAGGTPK